MTSNRAAGLCEAGPAASPLFLLPWLLVASLVLRVTRHLSAVTSSPRGIKIGDERRAFLGDGAPRTCQLKGGLFVYFLAYLFFKDVYNCALVEDGRRHVFRIFYPVNLLINCLLRWSVDAISFCGRFTLCASGTSCPGNALSISCKERLSPYVENGSTILSFVERWDMSRVSLCQTQ